MNKGPTRSRQKISYQSEGESDDDKPSTSTATPSTDSFSSPSAFDPKATKLGQLLAMLNETLEGTDKVDTSTAPLLSATSSLSETKESEPGEQKFAWDKIFDLFEAPPPVSTEAPEEPTEAPEEPTEGDPVTSFDKLKDLMALLNEQPEEPKQGFRNLSSHDKLLQFSTGAAEPEEEAAGMLKGIVDTMLRNKPLKISCTP